MLNDSRILEDYNSFFNFHIFQILFDSTFEETKKIDSRLSLNQRKNLIQSPFVEIKRTSNDFNHFSLQCIKEKLFISLIKINASFSVIISAFIYIDRIMVTKPDIFSVSTIEK